MKNNNDLFIKYYNVFAEKNSIYHLTVEELYLYGLLSILKNKQQLTITNVDIIHQYAKIKFFSREVESKQRIVKYLNSLKKKEIIKFDNDKFKNNHLLVISFMEDLKDESIGKGVNGFEKVDFIKFNSFESMIDNYIYFTVKRFDKMGGFKCDYNRWSDILKCSRKTAETKVNEAVEKKIIYKNIGDYTDELVNGGKQKKQEKNTYKTTPFAEDEKTIQTKKSEVKKQQNELIENEVSNNKTNSPFGDNTETREHNWYGKVKLTANDYYIYLTTNDKKLKKIAEKRIKALENSEKGIFVIENLKREGEEIKIKIEQKQLEEKLKSATNAIRLKDESVVIVDADNIDNYKLEDVKSFFYVNGGESLNREFNFKGFIPYQDALSNKKLDRPDMMQLGFKYYVKYVKNNIKINFKIGQEMMDKVLKNSGVDKFKEKTKVVSLNPKSKIKQEPIEEIDIQSLLEDLKEQDEKKQQKATGQSAALDFINKIYEHKINKDSQDINEFFK